jgi:hypothetical protein
MTPENNRTTSIVLDKLRSGDSISDKELVVAIETLEPVVKFLGTVGEMFYLPWIYLNEKLFQLEQFREARKRK